MKLTVRPFVLISQDDEKKIEKHIGERVGGNKSIPKKVRWGEKLRLGGCATEEKKRKKESERAHV